MKPLDWFMLAIRVAQLIAASLAVCEIWNAQIPKATACLAAIVFLKLMEDR